MRLHELTEGRMGDLHDTITRIRQLDKANIDIDEKSGYVWVTFYLDDVKGILRLKIRSGIEDPETVFAKRIRAAAHSETRDPTRKFTTEQAKNIITGKVSNNALKIMTNPDVWEVVALTHGDHKVPRVPTAKT